MKIQTYPGEQGLAVKPYSFRRFWLLPLVLMLSSSVPVAQAAKPNKKIQTTTASSFNNFDSLNLKVDVPAYPMLGKRRFIKIYDPNHEVLFLGEVSPNATFVMPVHKLKSAKKNNHRTI